MYTLVFLCIMKSLKINILDKLDTMCLNNRWFLCRYLRRDVNHEWGSLFVFWWIISVSKLPFVLCGCFFGASDMYKLP